jgi:hypothetical protein
MSLFLNIQIISNFIYIRFTLFIAHIMHFSNRLNNIQKHQLVLNISFLIRFRKIGVSFLFSINTRRKLTMGAAGRIHRLLWLWLLLWLIRSITHVHILLLFAPSIFVRIYQRYKNIVDIYRKSSKFVPLGTKSDQSLFVPC